LQVAFLFSDEERNTERNSRHALTYQHARDQRSQQKKNKKNKNNKLIIIKKNMGNSYENPESIAMRSRNMLHIHKLYTLFLTLFILRKYSGEPFHPNRNNNSKKKKKKN
jgi:hypothetical protein